jgi:hypothetical protein
VIAAQCAAAKLVVLRCCTTSASVASAGPEELVLEPSCSLADLPLAVLQPLPLLRSLQLPCVFDQLHLKRLG